MKTAAILLAAGKGTRMHSETPKVLHPVANHPMIRYPLDLFGALQLDHTVLVIGHGAEAVQDYVESRDIECLFAHQFEQRGTGHATRIGMEQLGPFEGTILVMPGDTPLVRLSTIQRLLDEHHKQNNAVTLLTTIVGDPKGYGRIVRDGKHVAAIIEHGDATPDQRAIQEINTAIYAFDSAFLTDAVKELKTDNVQGEFYITDVVAMAADKGRPATAVNGPVEELLGINTRVELAAASASMYARTANDAMIAGVTIHRPDSVQIDMDATLAPDVEIAANVCLRGKTTIASGTRVDEGNVITDSTIGTNTHIKPYCVIHEATIGGDARVGPFAHLRPGAELEDQVHVGNYVEVKKSLLRRGAKANHLTYLGDSEVGAATNVGAGTITCNYDGYEKHRTVIGEYAFIGSNVALVAPVTVGDRAIVGAGSTITTNVPADDLGVARGRQKNIEGYATKMRKKHGVE